jgi:hypothetical protein
LWDPKSNVMIVRLVLTLVQIFRVFPVPVKPDLGSVLSPFKGISQTLPMEEIMVAVRTLNMDFRWGPQKGYLSEKSGPNGRRATWCSYLDAFAFLHYPDALWNYLKISRLTGSY